MVDQLVEQGECLLYYLFKTPENFAWAIAKSIAKKGAKKYPTKPFIMESINNAAANFGTPEITKALEADIIIGINTAATSAGGTVT